MNVLTDFFLHIFYKMFSFIIKILFMTYLENNYQKSQ